jgi:ElaB/YqjD/DUF883 family membrane-anchored ribosome-binding protein
MTTSSGYPRAISSDVGSIERRLRILQNGIEKLGARGSSNTRDTVNGLGEAVASASSSWADRFRQGSDSLGVHSAAVGKDAARYGTAALSQIAKETEQRPLVAVAVALGIGVLIGMAASRRSW